MTLKCIKKYGGLVLLGGICGFFLKQMLVTEDGKQTSALQPPMVEGQMAQKVEMGEYIKQTGSISAYNSVDLVARVEGYLQKISFTDGDFVTKGQSLFSIEPEMYKEKLNEAEAAVSSAKANLTYTISEYQRQLRMFKQNATSQNSVESWLSKKLQAEADLAQAKANLISAQINYSYTDVKAPFDGRVGRHLIDKGNLVGSGTATTLATIEQITPAYAYFTLNEIDFIRLREAAQKRGVTRKDIKNVVIGLGLQDDKGYPYQGHLDFVDTGIDPSTGTMEVRAIIENKDKHFIPGLFVKVRLPLGPKKERLTVPTSALHYDQQGQYLYVVDKDNVVQVKRVTLGPQEDGRQAIAEGLEESDRVIVSGGQFATPGKVVRLKKAG